MEPLDEKWKQEVAAKLTELGVDQPCPRCRNPSFVLADGYFNQPLQTELAGLQLGGRSIPSVVLICGRCGFISLHAAGALGLLPTTQPEEVENSQ